MSSRRLVMLLPFSFVLGFILCCGCKRHPPAHPVPELDRVRIIDRTPAGPGAPPPLDRAALAQVARDTMVAAGGMVALPDGGTGRAPRYALRVEVRDERGTDPKTRKGVLRALVFARLEPLDADPGALDFEQAAMAERPCELDAHHDAAAFAAHNRRAVHDVVQGLGARLRIAYGSTAHLLAALSSKDPDLRDEAIRIAGERRERAALPGLIAILKSDDPVARDRAIGALAAIGDERAVRPLTEVARFREVAELPKVLDALSAIGGAEARSYLEFVASGHDNPEMRALAKQALDDMERRRAGRQVGGHPPPAR